MLFNTFESIQILLTILNLGDSLFKERVVESSQQYSVGWEDPTEQQEKARVNSRDF